MTQFGHSLVWLYAKGRFKVTCKPCGKSSRWLASREEGNAWALKHAKLREVSRRDSQA